MKHDLGRDLWGDEPTLVEVWAPTCAACRAMKADVSRAAAAYSGSVRFVELNAADEPDAVRALGVFATPTFIGFREGTELFRYKGRRTTAELSEMFASVASGRQADAVGQRDAALRVLAGVGVLGAGLLAGPAWPLVAVGAGITAMGVIPWIARST